MSTRETIVQGSLSGDTLPSAPSSGLSALRRKLATNWLQLFSGHMVASVLTLVSFILMSRAISVEFVGIIAIVQTYWRIICGLLSFQSLKVVISYGAEALANNDRSRFASIVRTCVSADSANAVFGLLIGLAGLWLLARSLNIPPAFDMMAMAAGVMMLSVATSALSGVLRLFDKFHFVAGVEVVTAAIRVVASGIGLVAELPAQYFLASWIIAQLVGDVVLILLGAFVLRREGYGNWFREPFPGYGQTKSLLRSMLAMNFSSTARFMSEEGDVLLVNAFLGAAGAGGYRVAKNLAAIIYRFTGPLINVIYPEISRLIAAGDRSAYTRIVTEINAAGGALGLAALAGWAVFGKFILEFTVGAQYAETYSTVLIFMSAITVALFGLCCLPTLLALQKWRQILVISIVSTAAFFASAFVLVPRLGIDGAAAAQVICYSVEVGLSLFVIRRALELRQWTTSP